jgi:hypothetical protein
VLVAAFAELIFAAPKTIKLRTIETIKTFLAAINFLPSSMRVIYH